MSVELSLVWVFFFFFVTAGRFFRTIVLHLRSRRNRCVTSANGSDSDCEQQTGMLGFYNKKKRKKKERAAAVTRQSRCTLKKKERNVHSESFVAYETGKMGHKETIASRGTKNVFLLLLLLFEFNYCARRLSFSLG